MGERFEEVEGLLRAQGLALTPQRRAIVRRLMERGGHWTAAELLHDLGGELPRASRATVYSTLALLRRLGVLEVVPGPAGELRFDANTESHQHFVCLRCGRLEDVPNDWFPVALRPGAAAGFRVERFRVVAQGVCSGCS